MQRIIEQITNKSLDASTAHEKLLNISSSFPEDFFNTALANGLQVGEVIVRAATAINLAIELTKVPEEKFGLVSVSRLNALSDAAAKLNESLAVACNSFEQFKDWGGVESVDSVSGTIHAKSGNSVDFATLLASISEHADAVLDSQLFLAARVRPKGIGTYLSASRVLQETAKDSKTLLDETKEVLGILQNEKAELDSRLENLKNIEESSSKSQNEITAVRQRTEEDAAKINSVLERTEGLSAKADDLSSQVNTYAAQFEGFDKALNDRNSKIGAGQKRLQETIEGISSKEKAVQDLINAAETMLGNVTEAGLASGYKDQNNELDDQIWYSQIIFYGSIAFLLLCALVTLDLMPGFHGLPRLPEFTDKSPAANILIQVFSAIGSRLLVLLPALLMVTFSAKRYASLFKLRQEYRHKFSTASSVHGFKLQAPKYEQQMAAAVFQELLKNPTRSEDSIGSSGTEDNKSFLGNLLEPHIQTALLNMAERKDEG
jgi:hypothetical protein